MSTRKYILNAEGEPVEEPNLMAWADWFEANIRVPFVVANSNEDSELWRKELNLTPSEQIAMTFFQLGIAFQAEQRVQENS